MQEPHKKLEGIEAIDGFGHRNLPSTTDTFRTARVIRFKRIRSEQGVKIREQYCSRRSKAKKSGFV